MSKVYVVINNALHHESSYWHIVGIFSDETHAHVCIATDKEDVLRCIDNGDFPGFDKTAEDPDMFINTNMWDDYIVSESGLYECWRVEEHELRDGN